MQQLSAFMIDHQLPQNIIVALLYIYFDENVLESRSRVLSWVSGILLLGVAAPLIAEPFPGIITFPFAIIIFFLWICVMYKNSLKEKLLAYTVVYFSINLCMCFFTAVVGITGADIDMEGFFPAAICYGMLSFCLLFMNIKVWSSISFVLKNPRYFSLFLLPFSQLLLIILSIFALSKMSDDNYLVAEISRNGSVALITMAILALSLAADGFFIRSAISIARQIRNEDKVRALEAKNKMTYEYLKSLESDVLELRKYRHDIVNIISTALFSLGEHTTESTAEAEKILGQLSDEIRSISVGGFCDSAIVNCILSHQHTKMTRDGIICDFTAQLDEALEVNELDFCRILVNLLDNAHEACLRLDKSVERSVMCGLKKNDGYLYIVVRNTKPDVKLGFRTSKSDDGRHGLGMSIISQIAQKNGGELIVNDLGLAVTMTVTMKLNEKE